MKKAIGIAVAAGVAASVLLGQPASAATPSVSGTPASWTPYITSSNTVVRQIAKCGGTMYAVGSFTSVGSPGHTSRPRGRAMAFSATNGTLFAWDPQVNGIVDSITFTPDCASAFLGGSFSSVHGTARANLVKVSTATGAVDTTFNPAPNGEVYSLTYTHGVLLAGGSFSSIAGTGRPAMASLNPTTGTATGYLNLNIQGHLPNSGRKVYNMEISHSDTRLLVMGNFTTVLGTARRQIFMLDLGSTTATLDKWYAPAFAQSCASFEPFWVQAAAWSPDDSKIYVATTGYTGASPICDTVAGFSSAGTSSQSPLWINRTGCDSLFSVAADGTNVYVGGHQRWLGNSACDSKGGGAYDRPGVGSVSAATGGTTSWNPTRARGKGADDMLLTSAGLWIASDNWYNSVKCGGAYHPGICFFPY